MSALSVRNLSGLLFGKMLVRGSGIVITLLLPRFWEPEEYGGFAAVFSLVLLLEALAPAGTHYTVLRESAKNPEAIRAHLRRAWRIAGPVTAGLALAVVLILLTTAPVTPTPALLGASALLLILRTPLWLHQAYFQSVERSRPIVLASSVDGVAKLVGLAIVVTSSLGVAGMITTMALGRLGAVTLLVVATMLDPAPRTPRGTPAKAPPARADAWVDPLLEFDIHFTQFVVAAWYSVAAAAFFKIASALVTLAVMGGYALNEALVPRLARIVDTDTGGLSARLSRSCTLHTLVGAVAAVGLMAGSSLIPLVFGSAYRPAIGPVLLLAALLPFRFWSLSIGNFFLSRNATREWIIALIAGAACAVVSAAVLVPSLGAWGGAASIGAGQLGQFVCLVWRARRRFTDFSLSSFFRFSELRRSLRSDG